jgi:hypothetical protein
LTIFAAALLGWFFLESDEDVIIDRVRALNSLAQIEKVEHPFVVAGQAKEIVAFFDSVITVDLRSAGAREIYESEQKVAQRQLLQIGTQFTKLETSVDHFEVDIEGNRATVELRASALGSLKGHDGEFLEIRRIKLVLVEKAGTWLIKEIEHLENLRDDEEVLN